jgi:hypothetical protein
MSGRVISVRNIPLPNNYIALAGSTSGLFILQIIADNSNYINELIFVP